MSQQPAAGRKPDPETPRPRHSAGRIEIELQEQVALMTGGMRDALARAQGIPLDYDGHGHNRSNEFQNAIALAKTSAELVLALGKLDGQFNHNIRVERVSADGGTPPQS